jgi:hypothetical protein
MTRAAHMARLDYNLPYIGPLGSMQKQNEMELYKMVYLSETGKKCKTKLYFVCSNMYMMFVHMHDVFLPV